MIILQCLIFGNIFHDHFQELEMKELNEIFYGDDASLFHYDGNNVVVALLIISNINAITYKEVFPLIQANKAWLGVYFGRGISGFIVPESYELYGTETNIEENGERIISPNNCMWLTSLDNEKRHKPIELVKKYKGNEDEYPTYDNYCGINVNKTQDIPSDYMGVMGEPITFLLDIPAAVKVPTAFDGIRYICIGSSKESAAKYPEREAQLFDVLKNGLPSICNTASEYQELSFERLFTYYAGRGIILKEATFKKNLGLLTNDGKYNIMAQLLSDDCRMPICVSIFRGETKGSPLFSIKEFGNTCILLSLDKILEYGDVINLIQTDERGRRLQRKDIPLFDNDAFREALVNAFVHNKWVDGNAPMITVFSNRIEILSRGPLAPGQTRQGFYQGESIPVNQKLSDLFLQLHISERSGRGVPKITEVYGENAFEFRENSIVVSLPYNRIDGDMVDNPVDNVVDNSNDLNKTQQKILMEIRNNPNVTQPQLAILVGIGKTAVQNNIVVLKRKGLIERVGSNKSGYWKVLE